MREEESQRHDMGMASLVADKNEVSWGGRRRLHEGDEGEIDSGVSTRVMGKGGEGRRGYREV